MKIAVTGGAGFIGANFIRYMLDKHPGYQIICLDCLTYAGNMENLSGVPQNKNFKFYCVDIRERKSVYKIFELHRPDAVVNFAAESHVDRSISDPSAFVSSNVLGTSVLLDAAREFGVKRFHQVSTDEVYGDLPLDRADLLFTEKTPLSPSSPYSASKAAADLLALSYYKTFGLSVTVSRCSNNYGPYQFPEKLIPLMISKALANESLPVYGDGKNIRDWLYVEDHCAAIDLILHDGKSGEVYNVGGHNERANIDIVKIILRELSRDESLITYVKDRPGHDRRYAIDPEKISTSLGWLPKTKFDDGIRKTIRWYLENRQITDNILNGKYKEINDSYRNLKVTD